MKKTLSETIQEALIEELEDLSKVDSEALEIICREVESYVEKKIDDYHFYNHSGFRR